MPSVLVICLKLLDETWISVCEVVQLCGCLVISAQTRQLVFCSRSRHPVTLQRALARPLTPVKSAVALLRFISPSSAQCIAVSGIPNSHTETKDSKGTLMNIGSNSKIHAKYIENTFNMCIFCDMPVLSLLKFKR